MIRNQQHTHPHTFRMHMASAISSQRHSICRKALQAAHTGCILHPLHKLFLTGSFSQHPPPLMLPGNGSPPLPAVLEVTAVPSITLPTAPRAKQLFCDALFPPDWELAVAKGLSERALLLEHNTVGCSLVP